MVFVRILGILLPFAALAANAQNIAPGGPPEKSPWSISLSGKLHEGKFKVEWKKENGSQFEALKTFEISKERWVGKEEVKEVFDGPLTDGGYDLKFVRISNGKEEPPFKIADGDLAGNPTSVRVSEGLKVQEEKSWVLGGGGALKDRFTVVVTRTRPPILDSRYTMAERPAPPATVAKPMSPAPAGNPGAGGMPRSQVPPSGPRAQVEETSSEPNEGDSVESIQVEVYVRSLPESEDGKSGELALLVIETTRLPGFRFNFSTRLKDEGGRWIERMGDPGKSAQIFYKSLELADLTFFKKPDNNFAPIKVLDSTPLPPGPTSRTFEVVAAECDPDAFVKAASECDAHSIEELRTKLSQVKGVILLNPTPRSINLSRPGAGLVSLTGQGYEYQVRLEIVGENVPGRADFHSAEFKDYGTKIDQSAFGDDSGESEVKRTDILKYTEFMEQLNANPGLSLVGVLVPSASTQTEGGEPPVEASKPRFLKWAPEIDKSANRLPLDAFLAFYEPGGEVFLVDGQGLVVQRSGEKDPQDVRREVEILSESMAAELLGGVPQPTTPTGPSPAPVPSTDTATLPASPVNGSSAAVSPEEAARSAIMQKLQQQAYAELMKVPLVAFSHQDLKLAQGIRFQVNEKGLQTDIPFADLVKAGELKVGNGEVARWFKLVGGKLTAEWPQLVDKQNGPIVPSADQLEFEVLAAGSEPAPPPLDKSNPDALRRGLVLCALLKATVSVSSPFRETQKVQPFVRSDGKLELPLSDGAVRKFQLKVAEKKPDLGNFPISRAAVGGWTLEFTGKDKKTNYTFPLTDRDDISLQEILSKTGSKDLSEVTGATLSFVNAGTYASGIPLQQAALEAFTKEKFLISNFVPVMIEIPSEDLYATITLEPADFEALFPGVYLRYNKEEYLILTRFAKEKIKIRGDERSFGSGAKTWKWNNEKKKFQEIQDIPLRMKPALVEGIYPLDAVVNQLPKSASDPLLIDASSAFRGCQDVLKNLEVFHEKNPEKLKGLFPRGSSPAIVPLEFVVGEQDGEGKTWKPVPALFLLPEDGGEALPCEGSPTSEFVFRRVIQGTGGEAEFNRLKGGFTVATDAAGNGRLSALLGTSDKGFPKNHVLHLTQEMQCYFFSAISPQLSDQHIDSPPSPAPPAAATVGPLHIVIINETLDINLLTLVVKKIHKLTWRASDDAKSIREVREVQFHVVFQGPESREVVSGDPAVFGEENAPSIPEPGVALALANFGNDRIASSISLIEGKLGQLPGNFLIFVNAEPSVAGPENLFLKENNPRVERQLTGTGGFSEEDEKRISEQIGRLLAPAVK